MRGTGTGPGAAPADRRPVHDAAPTRSRLLRAVAAAALPAALALVAGSPPATAPDAAPARLALAAPRPARGTGTQPAVTAGGHGATPPPPVAAHWTRRRMAAARPADVGTVAAGLRQARATGLDAYL